MPQIARTNYGNQSSQPLRSPYEAHGPDLIQPGDDFTVQATTISQSILEVYGQKMKKQQFGNDYFILMSHFGIGSNQGELPSNTINLVEPCAQIRANILSFWGENIRWIQDYRDRGRDGNAGRVYIGTSAFCQGIGPTPLEAIRKTFQEVTSLVGRFSPALAPYVSVANQALDGVVRIADKLKRNPGEIVTSRITLYPETMGTLPAGNAYLQRGSYVLFFDETPIDHLFLTPSGEVVANNQFEGTIPPYVVVNIVDGLIDAPDSEALDKSVALDLIEKYDSRFGLPRHASDTGSGTSLNEGLATIGKSYRVLAMLHRFAELNGKPDPLASEQARISKLRQELQAEFPTLTF